MRYSIGRTWPRCRNASLLRTWQAALQAALAGTGDGSRRPKIRNLINKADQLDYFYAHGMTRKLKARITGRNI
jgi:hypothetical protein